MPPLPRGYLSTREPRRTILDSDSLPAPGVAYKACHSILGTSFLCKQRAPRLDEEKLPAWLHVNMNTGGPHSHAGPTASATCLLQHAAWTPEKR